MKQLAQPVYLCEEESVYRFDGRKLQVAPPKEARKGFAGAVLHTDLIHSYTFKIPVDTSEEKLAALVEIKMYEEGGLNIEKEYSIAFVKHALDFESSWLIEAFAAEQEKLHAHYGKIVALTGHIDLLAVPYLIYESLYAEKMISPEGADLFIYLGDTEAFGVLCKDGHYAASRILPSIASIAKKAGVDTLALRRLWKKNGVHTETYEAEDPRLVSTVSDAFSQIVDRIIQSANHKRSIFSFDHIDHLYLDFEGEEIPGFFEMFDLRGLQIESKEVLPCCKGEKVGEGSIHQVVEALYCAEGSTGDLEAPNLTIFEPSPPFYRTYTGYLFIAGSIGALCMAGVALYMTWTLQNMKNTQLQLQQKHKTLEKQYLQLRQALALEKKKYARLNEEMKSYRDIRDGYLMTFEAIGKIAKSHNERRRMLRDVDSQMGRYGLSAFSLEHNSSTEQNDSTRMQISLLSAYSERDRIAKFIKRMLQLGYKHVDTDAIVLDKTLYQSLVEVKP